MNLKPIPNAETSFMDLMALEKVPGKEYTYMSKTPAWSAGGSWSAFGGHVYAQSCWAAAQEVGVGRVVHSTHGYFTLPGKVDRPFIFTVSHISNTRATCQRSVSVRQPRSPCNREASAQFAITDAANEMADVCFHMICSFKSPSPARSSHQAPSWTRQYGTTFTGRRPADFDICPAIDMPQYVALARATSDRSTFPGLEIRKAECAEYNAGKAAGEYRQLNYYRLVGEVSGQQPQQAANLHAAAHLYASDRNSLFLIPSAVGFADRLGRIASLGHSVIFHTDAEDMMMEGEGWWVQEAWTPRSGNARAVHESRLWSPSGVHVATTLQDGLVKKAEPGMKAIFEGVVVEGFRGVNEGEGEQQVPRRNQVQREGAKL